MPNDAGRLHIPRSRLALIHDPGSGRAPCPRFNGKEGVVIPCLRTPTSSLVWMTRPYRAACTVDRLRKSVRKGVGNFL